MNNVISIQLLFWILFLDQNFQHWNWFLKALSWEKDSIELIDLNEVSF